MNIPAEKNNIEVGTAVSGVSDGINIRGKRRCQYPGLATVSISGVNDGVISGVSDGINIRG